MTQKPTDLPLPDSPELETLALEAWVDASGDVDRAVLSLRHRLGRDRELYLRLVDPLVQRALRLLVEAAIEKDDADRRDHQSTAEREARDRRQTSACDAASPVVASRESRPSAALLAGMRATAERNLLEFQLSSGIRLGDASPDDALREAIASELFADSELRKSRWLRLVAAACSDRRSPIRDQLRHEQLRDLLHRSAVPKAEGVSSGAAESVEAR